MNWLQEKINTFKKSRFVKDLMAMQFSSAFTRFLAVVASIVFARFLGAENYGLYALVFGFVAFSGAFMGMEGGSVILILLPQAYQKKDKAEITNIISYFIKINFLTSFVVGLLIIIIAPHITTYLYHSSTIGNLARILILGMIITSFSEVLTLCLQSIRKIKILVTIESLSRILEILIPITLVFLGFGLKGIVWGYFINNLLYFVIALTIYSAWTKRNPLLPKFSEIAKGFFAVKMKKYFNFGFLMLVDKKIASLYSNLSLMMLGIFVPASVVGYFKLASKYISLTSVLTKPIANLLMVQLPKSIVTGARIFKDNLEKVSLYTLLLTLPVVGGMLVVGAFLVRLLYGAQYEPVIPLIYYLAFWPILSSYVIGVGASIRVLGLMKQSISVNSLVILLGLPIVYWLVKSYDVYGAVVALTVWNNIAAYIMFCLTRRHLKEKIIQEQSV